MATQVWNARLVMISRPVFSYTIASRLIDTAAFMGTSRRNDVERIGKSSRGGVTVSGRISRMLRYSPFIDGLLSDSSLLQKHRPTESANPATAIRIRKATDTELTGGKEITSETLFPLVRGGPLYAVDAIDESHRIAQQFGDETGSYWQGMIHRRKGDFDNARYWFRRVGSHPVFGELHHAAAGVSPDMAKQSSWDPYLFVGLCEREKFGDDHHRGELIKLQRIEFDALFDYVWRKSFG